MFAKRLFDVIASLAGLLLVWPLFLLIVVAIKLDGLGPIFFRQIRVGRGGEHFAMIKFRTMVPDAEQLGGYSTVPGDSRITQVGRLLRKTSLDELPQLLNVLLGDMSLVGPRPDVPAQREGYSDDEWRIRHSLRPGITGLAQATVRSNAGPGERKMLDLQYVERFSLWLDVKILLLTIRQVLGRGSY